MRSEIVFHVDTTNIWCRGCGIADTELITGITAEGDAVRRQRVATQMLCDDCFWNDHPDNIWHNA